MKYAQAIESNRKVFRKPSACVHRYVQCGLTKSTDVNLRLH